MISEIPLQDPPLPHWQHIPVKNSCFFYLCPSTKHNSKQQHFDFQIKSVQKMKMFYTSHFVSKHTSEERRKITCDGSPTIAFLSRTHFFKANPLFRISAINSEGCIDGPVSTNHSFRVPLMSGHRQPPSPQWEFQGRLC